MMKRLLGASLGIILGFVLVFLFTGSHLANAGGGPITVTISQPDTVIYGYRSFDTVISMTNTGQSPSDFSGMIRFGGAAWGGGSQVELAGMEMWWQECGTLAAPDGCAQYVRGTIGAGEYVTYTLHTNSGTSTGTYPFITTTFLATGAGEIRQSRDLNVVQGSESAKATLLVEPDWKPGEYKQVSLVLESPVLTQFRSVEPLSSSCGIEGLPANVVGKPNRTYETFSWYLRIPENVQPGECIITGKIELVGQGTLLTPTFKFTPREYTPVVQTFLPSVARAGERVTIEGEHFLPPNAQSLAVLLIHEDQRVTALATPSAPDTVWEQHRISFLLPDGLSPQVGKVVVLAGKYSSSAIDLEVVN